MKHFMSLLIFSFMLFSCNHEKANATTPKINTKIEPIGIPIQVDIQNSKINWFGYKIMKNENLSHFGSLSLQSGTFYIENEKLTAGKFIANMNSLLNTDIDDATMKTKLETHLKDSDFLETQKFPTAEFEITTTKTLHENDYNTEIQGNLTLKSITKNITLKANIVQNEGIFAIFTEKFSIKRSDFNLLYNGNGESIITETFDLQLVIKGKK